MPPPPFGECIRQAEIWVQSKFPYEQRHAAMSRMGFDAESRRCEGEDSHKAVQETCEQSPAQRKNCQKEKEAKY